MMETGNRKIEDLSGEEFARRGNRLFEERVLPKIDDPATDARKFVAIDIETGDYEVGESNRHAMDATRRLLERRPEAKGRIWFRRVGSSTSHRIRSIRRGSRLDAEAVR